MSSIIDDLAPATRPKGKFWDALEALRDKDEEGYQAYAAALMDPSYGPVDLQRALTKHTGIRFSHSRISDVRDQYTDKGELPV